VAEGRRPGDVRRQRAGSPAGSDAPFRRTPPRGRGTMFVGNAPGARWKLRAAVQFVPRNLYRQMEVIERAISIALPFSSMSDPEARNAGLARQLGG
jgi:hypothetical protein